MAKINRKMRRTKPLEEYFMRKNCFPRNVGFVIYEMMEVRCISFG